MKSWFNKFFRGSEKTVIKKNDPSEKGVLGQFNLWSWWYETFSDEERKYILEKYNPFPDYPPGESVLTHGNISIAHPRTFLSSIALWFNDPEGVSIALKFMDKAHKYPHSDLDTLDYHFDCHERIKFYYRWRNEHEGALEAAIFACKEQIAIAKKSAPACLEEFKCLPRHTGYEQLAIIYEKQGKLEEAIAICEQGRVQGWANDFEKRLTRLNKRFTKFKDKDKK